MSFSGDAPSPTPMVLGLNTELLVVIALVLLLFGGSQIPKLARSLGRAKGEFQKSRQEFERELSAGERESRADAASEERVERNLRQTAREMGVPEEGRSLDEVKKDLNARLG